MKSEAPQRHISTLKNTRPGVIFNIVENQTSLKVVRDVWFICLLILFQTFLENVYGKGGIKYCNILQHKKGAVSSL